MVNSPGDGREAALRGLHEYKQRLAAQMATLEKDMSAVARSITLLEDAAPTSPGLGEAQQGFAALGPTAAVIRLLREAGGRAFKPTIIRTELMRRGFIPTNPKTFAQQVASTVKRLMKKQAHNIKRKQNRDGHWVYYMESTNPAE